MINASLAGVIEEAQRRPEVDRVLGMRRGVEGLLEGQVIDLTDLTGEQLELLSRTPGSALGACRLKVSEEQVESLLGRLLDREVAYFCYIGGNDSADTTHKIACAADRGNYDLRAMAVPKTIDNDLPDTDHCPGFGSIARYVATAAAETTLDTRSLPSSYPVKILEVMGRDAGWVAAAAGLARSNPEDGPQLIYVPERPFDPSAFLEAISDVHRHRGWAVAAVAETIRDSFGNPIAADTAGADSFGHPLVRGTAATLVGLVEKELGLTARFDKPGTLQRSSLPAQSPVDRSEAWEVGRAAVGLAIAGQSDRMVTIKRLSDTPYQSTTGAVKLDRVANRQKLLPREYLDETGTFITDAFRQYAMPLLGPEPFAKLIEL